MARTKMTPAVASAPTTMELLPSTPQTSSPTPPEVVAPITPTAPLMRAQKMNMMMGQLMARSMSNQVSSAVVLPTSLDPDTWSELSMIQQAVVRRLQQQQKDWVQGCESIALEYSQLKLANTMSKFVEQEYNIVAQFGTLLSSQAASWFSLMENIQVDYAYWLSQKRAASAP
ncbi:MAG: hypothetical protein QM749_12260 [Aquabacterium sp.]